MVTKINARAFATYQMPEGDGRGAALSKDGPRMLKTTKAEVDQSPAGNTTLNLVYRVMDDDIKEEQGAVIYQSFAVTGSFKDRDGNEIQNVTRLAALLISAGRPQTVLENYAKEGDVDLDAIAKTLVSEAVDATTGQPKNVCYGMLVQELDDRGEKRTNVKFHMKREKYEEAKKTGVGFRREPAPKARKAATSNGAGAPQTHTNTETATIAEGI